MPNLRKIAASGTAAGLAVLLTACNAGAGSSPSAGAGGGSSATTAAIAFALEPENLDFTRTDGAAIPQVLLTNVYEGLVELDQDGKIVPLLAESWKVSTDRKSYTFELRKGVTFSNGSPFDASTVKFSIDRVKKDWTISLKKAMDVVDTVTVDSPTRVTVKLSRPSNDWLFKMTTRIGAMMSPDGVADLANKPVGTGPYTVARWVRGDSITLKARPGYWGTEPAMSTVVFRYFKDPTASTNALLSGGIDAIGNVAAPDSLIRFESDPTFKIIEGTSNGEVTLSMNNKSKAFGDKRVRQAVRYALDHQAILDTAWAGRGTLIGAPVPPTDPWYEDLTGLFPHDPQKARNLLAEAGKTDLTVRLRLPNVAYALSAGQVVKSQLADVGITADIDVLEFPARWLDLVFNKHDYDMSIINHVEPRDIANYANPDYYFGYDSPKVQSLMAAADEGTPEQQVADLRAAARQISEDAAADWLFLFPYLVVARANLQGLPKNGITESFDVTGLSR
ncbi:MAG: ABC transporter substrate-binding protein [Intrasporangium sp.]|uniref:ABC transporter substrate-binding protein n=1 Tax=Intrasporangium sp. TaxID=1925024 RepID=UPI0026491AB6|nr:ABC transporter substrate-binding protein [Intrasporangium sp.]MDN5794882.1 ABC transporter substrate-binding protein [Intrasporangium sp.]